MDMPDLNQTLRMSLPKLSKMHERNLYMGIDPGLSGGFGILDPDGNLVDASTMGDSPREIYEYMQEFGPRIKFAMIENVHSFPGQGVSSTFKFGWNKGLLDMALVTIPHEGVQPGTWQKPFGLIRQVKTETITDKKNRHKAVAEKLFPTVKMKHALVDGLLLAEFCRRKARGLL